MTHSSPNISTDLSSVSAECTLPETFTVDDAASANWVVRKIIEARNYAKHVKEWAEAECQRAEREEQFFFFTASSLSDGPNLRLKTAVASALSFLAGRWVFAPSRLSWMWPMKKSSLSGAVRIFPSPCEPTSTFSGRWLKTMCKIPANVPKEPTSAVVASGFTSNNKRI